MDATANYPRFDQQQELELHARMIEGDMEAKDLLAKSQWCLAIKMANQASRGQLDRIETLSLAGIGLAYALERFVPSRGRLSTCVGWSVRQVVWKHMKSSMGAVHVPMDIRKGSPQEKDAERARRPAVSLSTRFNDSRRATVLGDSLSAKSIEAWEQVERQQDMEEQRRLCRWAIRRLGNKRSAAIVVRKMNGETLASIGSDYGISKQAVQSAYTKAVSDMKALIEEREGELCGV